MKCTIEVCPGCGDILLAPDAVRRIEQLLSGRRQPDANVPLYEFT